MRPPDELDRVPWHALTHAYGTAEDVPELIRALYDGGEDAADEAVYELFGNIHHQGTVYPASAPAVPFLAHAVRHAPAATNPQGKREELLMLLACLADHDPDDVGSPHWDGSPVAEACAELCRVLPELLPCLEDDGRAVRRAALRVVGAVADLVPAGLRASVLSHVDALYATDPVPAVRADALVVLDRSGRETAGLGSPLPEVRLAGAMLAAERSGPPYAPEVVEILAEDGAEPDPGDDDFPWSGTVTGDERLTRLLAQDPDAGLAVAARWIAAGDLGARGLWTAQEIVRTWRDRETEALDLLAAALPHQKDARTRAYHLRTLGGWITYVPEPSHGLRDALYHCARAEGDEAAAPALLALVRARDPRALELVLRRHDAAALRAAAAAFPDAADRLIPVIRRALAAGATGNDGIALVEALAPFGSLAHEARPELVDCVRTRRAPLVAARRLGLDGVLTRDVAAVLEKAVESTDTSLSVAAAVALYRLTGDAGSALRTLDGHLRAQEPAHWLLSSLQPLGDAGAPLLPYVEPLLEAAYAWTRMAAAEAHHGITGSPDLAVPVLVELVGPTPVGLRALRALAAIGPAPEEIRPALRSLAFSPLRQLDAAMPFGQHHPDEELRDVARSMLVAG